MGNLYGIKVDLSNGEEQNFLVRIEDLNIADGLFLEDLQGDPDSDLYSRLLNIGVEIYGVVCTLAEFVVYVEVHSGGSYDTVSVDRETS